MTLDGEMSFSRIKNLHVNASMAVKILGGICVHALAKIWKHLKDTLAFLSFIVCKNRNRVLLTSDLLPNISLAVGRSSGNI